LLRVPASGGTIGADFGSGALSAGTLRVVLATDQPAIPTVSTVTALTTLTGGGVAGGAADSGNPVKVGGKYNSTQPTLDNGDRGDIELDSRGRVRVAIGACETCTATETAITEDAAYTTQQTGAAVWTPAAGLKVYVAAVQIQCGGTTAGTVRLWFGASGDTTYTAGTDQQLTFVNCGTPSADVAPGMVWSFPIPVAASTADFILRATTSAGITVDIIVHGYER
ncbi:MAG TPA: hypothetical protein VFB99_02965, partial [Vicinamibacterales bacterium]|nr:hypothetical protein [Vicinamibacterales bacterium]